jgi:hypothetical protein
MVPVVFIYGPSNTGSVVEYCVMDVTYVDGITTYVTYRDWTTDGVTESPGSGTFIVFLDTADISGRLVRSRIQGTDRTTDELFPSVAGGSVDPMAIAAEIMARFSTLFSGQDAVRMTRGTGSVAFDTSKEPYTSYRALGKNDKPFVNIVIRMFKWSDTGPDFTKPSARDVTDQHGDYLVYIDPGTYTISFEKNGEQLDTTEVTVP